MAIVKKEYEISLDIKRSVSNREFEVVAGDTGNVLNITLTDDGQPVHLTGCFVQAVFSKSDGSTAAQHNLPWINEQGQQEPNAGVVLDQNADHRLRIELYAGSFVPGMVECEVQVFSKGQGESINSLDEIPGATLVTSAKFNFSCRHGIAGEETVTAQPQWPVLVGVLESISGLGASLDQAEEQRRNSELARLQAEAARSAAEEQRHAAEAVRVAAEEEREASRTAYEDAEAQRQAAEIARAGAEQDRITAETGRNSAEVGRNSAETARVTAEEERSAAEQARSAAESERDTAEQERTAAEQARVSAESARTLWEEYKSDKAYVAGNKVVYQDASYVCIRDAAAGVLPTRTDCWLRIVAAGGGGMDSAVYDPNGVASDIFTHARRHAIGGADALTPWDIGAMEAPLHFFKVSVYELGWEHDDTYEGYEYRQDLYLRGVQEDMIPRVVFDLPQADSGNYAPVCRCGNGWVRIFAKERPEEEFVLPTVICERMIF